MSAFNDLNGEPSTGN